MRKSAKKSVRKSAPISAYASTRQLMRRLLDWEIDRARVIEREICALDAISEPSAAQILKARGITFAYSGRIEQAIADLSAALMAKYEDDGYVQAKLAQQYALRGRKADLDAAVELCERVRKKPGLSKEVRWLANHVLAAASLSLGDRVIASEAALRASKIRSDARTDALLLLARAVKTKGPLAREAFTGYGRLPSADASENHASGESQSTIGNESVRSLLEGPEM